MTSTNINIGIDGRTSSRVLKPPGGAHTNIFGAPERNDCSTGRFAKQPQKSSISECFEYKYTNNREVVKENGDLINSNENEPINTISEEKNLKLIDTINEEENSKPIEKPMRVRVPPGGFSTSLW